MSKEAEYFQFPLCLLALPDNGLAETIICYSIIEAGSSQIKGTTTPEEIARQGAKICGITFANVDALLESRRKAQYHVTKWTKRYGPEPLIRIRKSLCFAAKDGDGISMREFRVLCAIYSVIGRAMYKIVRFSAIATRTVGCKSASLLNGAKLLTPNELRGTVARLHELGFFARVTPNPHGRKTYYSNRMTEIALRERLKIKLTFSHSFANERRAKDREILHFVNEQKTTPIIENHTVTTPEPHRDHTYNINTLNRNTLNRKPLDSSSSSITANPPQPTNQSINQPGGSIQEIVKELEPKVEEYGWGLPEREWITQEEMNKLAADNPHRILEIGRHRFPTVSVGGLVTRIEQQKQ